jgi:hypothetical protein
MLNPNVSDFERRAYYQAALVCLRFLERERPTGRRFGVDADARFEAFRGELKTADRIDLLLRDADAQWPGAFGARAVFALAGAAEDDPFSAHWSPLLPVLGEDLWRQALSGPEASSVREVLVGCAAAWELGCQPFVVAPVGPTDELLVAGPSAIAAVAEVFAVGAGLDWSAQVGIVASRPAERQMGALCAALLKSSRPTRLLERGAVSPDLLQRCRLVLSDDAVAADLEAVRR